MKKTLLLVCTALFLSAPLKSFSLNQAAPNIAITPCMAGGLAASNAAYESGITDGETLMNIAMASYNACVEAGGY